MGEVTELFGCLPSLKRDSLYDFNFEHEAIWDEETDTYTHILKTKGRKNDWILTWLIGKIIERMRRLNETET